MIKSLENFNKLKFNFEYKNRLIRTNFDNNEYFKFDTPFLKVLKPIHTNTNKKKNTEKNYIILEIFDNYNVNNELDDFLILINKLHEISQENIKKNSLKWFNTEFDEIGLDLKVKKPIDKQKDKQFIKIIIPNDNDELFNKIKNLNKNDYVMSSIFYKGLKVSNDYIMGEYELINLITQDEYESNNKIEINDNDNELLNFVENQLEANQLEDNQLEENQVEENQVEENQVEENQVEENQIEENQIEENKIEENQVEENQVEENQIEENQVKDITIEENLEENIKKNQLNKETIENNSINSHSIKIKKNNKDNKFIKLVTRKNKSLIFI